MFKIWLVFRVEPLTVKIMDDWSLIPQDSKANPLELSFTSALRLAAPGAAGARSGKGSKVLEYDFLSKFIHRMNQANTDTYFEDDIYITLNISLYSYLALMRRNLSREMDQFGSRPTGALPENTR